MWVRFPATDPVAGASVLYYTHLVRQHVLNNVMLILADLYSPDINQRNFNAKELGIDSREYLSTCPDPALEQFENYPYDIEYKCNSRGFRGSEWSTDVNQLKQSIWCIGDSFTFGVGVAYEHTWPYVLEQKTNTTAINVGMHGVGNTWLVEQALYIINEISPKTVVLHWTYTHRRKVFLWEYVHNQSSTEQEDADLLINCVRDVEQNKKSTNIIHSFIPDFHDDSEQLYRRICDTFNNIKIVPCINPLDYGRDSHHYGKTTADKFVSDIIQLI